MPTICFSSDKMEPDLIFFVSFMFYFAKNVYLYAVLRKHTPKATYILPTYKHNNL